MSGSTPGTEKRKRKSLLYKAYIVIPRTDPAGMHVERFVYSRNIGERVQEFCDIMGLGVFRTQAKRPVRVHGSNN